MAKRTMPKGLTRQIIAGANPAAGAKQFAMPRSSEDLSLANLGLDFIDWTPAAPVAYGVDVAYGDQEFDPLVAAIMGIPFVPSGASKKASTYMRRLFNKGYGRGELKKELIEELGPEAGEVLYDNLASKRSNLTKGKKKSFFIEPSPQHRMSSRGQVNADITEATQLAPNTVVGPTGRSNTGSTVRSQGQQMMDTNTRKYPQREQVRGDVGALGYQGPMYDPRRELKQSEYGPFQTADGMLPWASDPYAIHLNNNLNELRNKYEFLVNRTRTSGPEVKNPATPLPKDDAMAIAIAQGRPDIADIINVDNKVRVAERYDPRFTSYRNQVNRAGGIEKYLDNSNRAVEKELREMFATIPDNHKEAFAKHYGVWDLLDDWRSDPAKWSDYAKEVKSKRYKREKLNAFFDRRYRQ